MKTTHAQSIRINLDGTPYQTYKPSIKDVIKACYRHLEKTGYKAKIIHMSHKTLNSIMQDQKFSRDMVGNSKSYKAQIYGMEIRFNDFLDYGEIIPFYTDEDALYLKNRMMGDMFIHRDMLDSYRYMMGMTA